MPLIYIFKWINEFRQLWIKTSWSTLIKKGFLEGTGSCYQMDPLVLINPIKFSDGVLIRMLLCCWLLPDTANVSKKTKKTSKKIRSTWPLVRLVCASNCLWWDHPRPKWPLIRQVQDHCPDKSELEAFSRPCSSSAPRTCVRSKMVWSELNLVWPPRRGWGNLIKRNSNKITFYETEWVDLCRSQLLNYLRACETYLYRYI